MAHDPGFGGRVISSRREFGIWHWAPPASCKHLIMSLVSKCTCIIQLLLGVLDCTEVAATTKLKNGSQEHGSSRLMLEAVSKLSHGF